MKALLLLLLSVQAAVNTRVSVKTAPVLPTPVINTAQHGITPGLTPTLTPSLTPTVQLQNLSTSLSPDSKKAPEGVLSAAFDNVEVPKTAETSPVAVGEVAQSHANLAEAESRAHAARFKAPPASRTLGTRLWEASELAAYWVPFNLAAYMSLAAHSWSPALQAAVWTAAGAAMVHRLGELRQRVVGGWQASHDQKYRVGWDGQMRDVRGHKYGSDRYEEYAPGEVSKTEKGVIAAVAAASALAWSLVPWL